MSEADAAFGCLGICCVCLAPSLQTWCNQTALGSRGCCCGNGQAGCCGSCCGDSFNEDAFDKEVKKDLARTKTPDAEPITNQPSVGETMTVQHEKR